MGAVKGHISIQQALQTGLDLHADEISVDYFAGAGGASQGYFQATGKHIGVAVNHNEKMLSLHAANHPTTHHIQESVWDIDPAELLKGKKVGFLWGSPDCRHFSRAKSGVPVEKNIRGLSWVLLKFALIAPPRIFGMENVEEIMDWSPLVDGYPCKERKGETFDGFIKAWTSGITPKDGAWLEMVRTIGIEYDVKAKLKLFKGLGYALEYRALRMSDYGVRTKRKRFFLLARNDGKPIQWPEVTHADHKLKSVQKNPVLSQLPQLNGFDSCIDWSVKCKSVLGRNRMPVKKSLQRLVRGLERFVIDEPDPYIVSRENMSQALPFLTEHANGSTQRNFPANEPLRTQCASVKGGHFALVAPTFIYRHFGKSVGSAANEPVGTITAGGGGKTMIVAASMLKHYGGGYTGPGYSLRDPAATITTKDHHALLTSHLIKYRGTNTGQKLQDSLQTVTAGGLHFGEVRSLFLKVPEVEFGNMMTWPVPGRFDKAGEGVVARDLTEEERYNAWWIARLVEENSERIQPKTMPSPQIPEPRLPFIMIDGWILADIAMRMLTPRELARAHHFPESYILDQGVCGTKLTIQDQVFGIGNSVPPEMVELLIRAVAPEICTEPFINIDRDAA